MTANDIRTVYYAVDDMARATRFYEEALGFAVKFADGDRWTQFDGARGALALASGSETVPDQRGAVAVFGTEDLEATCTAIERAGGRILARRDMASHGTVVTFADTEGNVGQIFASRRE
jgi:predicted enzyme related to lactoylglutathione lyase